MLNANDNLFNRIAAPIERISSFSRVTIIGILIAGAIIIMLLMSIVIRERKLEIGILRSLGLKKGKLAAQFAMEALIIALVATFQFIAS
ncbi:FtsX-like permease family protein [Caldicellulosiruptor obsidiansis]|uniref:FtsX-like permease family protein n=1 Tax=Caldicellulosiruptor obsidiansis TaxID=717609 RepID=UPI0002D3AD50|nr:FtsX-like permease family protein [Caldicellulosiruptor obsidiansis]